MLRFQNDYSEGAHPNVLRALCDTNLCSTPGYGLDDDCRRAADAIRARFACPDADVHFLVGGTQTNQLAAAAFLRPWEAMVAADTGQALGFVLRDTRHAEEPSPAALRLEITVDRSVLVRKCRGGPAPGRAFPLPVCH